MIKRRKTRVVAIKSVRIGGNFPIAVQTMTKVATKDGDRCLQQVKKLAKAGAALIRIAVPTKADTAALAKIIENAPVPIIADVHFSPARAIEAIEAGTAKIRLNPGNIKKRSDILRIIDCARANGTAIRAGVNEASIRDLRGGDIPPQKRVRLMLAEMKKYVRLFEKKNFTNLVLSAKSADTVRTIEINRLLSKEFDYPLHLGLTHAGLSEDAKVPSAVAIGGLLAEGIGDTIRVSVAGDPSEEIRLGKEILNSLGLHERRRPELIVCPTCGRCQIDVVKLAKQVKRLLKGIDKPLRVAVMGCVVNGPGEAVDADIAVCAAKGKGFIYRNGRKKTVVPEPKLIGALAAEIAKSIKP